MGLPIKHWLTGAVLYEHDGDNLREAVETAVAKGICLDGASLNGASLNYARLVGASLVGASLSRASLVGASLDGANLVGASLDGANLVGASLDCANLDGASLVGASLVGANLDGARLYRANLDGASLVGARLDGEILKIPPVSISNLRWFVLITPEYMRIGCKRYSHEEWAAFSDAEISAMDNDAAAFWSAWKAPLMAMCDAHRAEHYKAMKGKQ